VVRDGVLGLLRALLVNKHNAQQFTRCGGLQVLVRLAALVHLDRHGASSTAAPMTTNLLAGGSPAPKASQEYRYWFRHPTPIHAPSTTVQAAQGGEDEEQGEGMLLSEIAEQMAAQRNLTQHTMMRAKGAAHAKKLADWPQLAWTVCVDCKGGHSREQVSIMCLEMLQHMCGLFPSVDAEGRAKLPSPLIRRKLLADDCLCHLVQLLLAGSARIVDAVAPLVSGLVPSLPLYACHRLLRSAACIPPPCC
jgi:hypothetical protein